ncbi:hypothetical protein KY284_017227 [Solanum tuberosum]|nr:hypothetical protein KY284_017227 [Solanum tuberosum]
MAENENDWDLGAIVRSCSKMSNSALVDHGVHEDSYSALVDHSVHEDGNSVNTSLFQEERNCVGDFKDAFAMENKRYFGLDEVISLSRNLNTNSRIAPHNQENQTETIPNTPLVIIEHEEEKKKKKKKARYSMQSSSTESGKRIERHEILYKEFGKAEQWRWIMNKTSTTGKNYYLCSEFKKKCPAKRHVEQSSTDPTKVIVTYKGEHNHPPPNQHRSPNAAAPSEDPSSSSFVP